MKGAKHRTSTYEKVSLQVDTAASISVCVCVCACVCARVCVPLSGGTLTVSCVLLLLLWDAGAALHAG